LKTAVVRLTEKNKLRNKCSPLSAEKADREEITARLEPNLKAGQEETKAGYKEMIAGQKRMLAKMDSWLVKMKAPDLLATEEEVKVVMEQQEVLDTEMNYGVLEDRYGDLCLAVRRCNQPKEWTEGDGGSRISWLPPENG
jgi:hypothetical protein